MATFLQRWLRGSHHGAISKTLLSAAARKRTARQGRRSCLFEPLEARTLLSATSLADIIASPAVASGGYTVVSNHVGLLGQQSQLHHFAEGHALPGMGPARRSPSSTRTTTRTSSATWRRSTPSSAFAGIAKLKVVSQTGSTHQPARHRRRLGVWKSRWTSSGPMPSRRRRTSCWSRPSSASLSDLLTAVKYAANYLGRVGGLDELGKQRIPRRNLLRQLLHDARRPHRRDVRRLVGRQRNHLLAVGLVQRPGGRRNDAHRQFLRRLLSETAWSGSGGGVSKL